MRSGLRRFTPWRRLAQAVVAALFMALPFLAARGQRAVVGTLVALEVGPLDLVEPAAALGAFLAAGGAGGLRLLLGAAPLLLLALALGPVFCSWLCPWGLLSEGIDRLRRRARPWPDRSWERVRTPRALALVLLATLSLAAAVPLLAILDGPRLITALPLECVALRAVPPVTGALLLALLGLELVGPRRIWCRSLCPAGAVSAYLRTRWTLRVHTDMARCRCPTVALCHAECPWGVDPRRMGRSDGCTTCLACVDGCPSGALTPGFGRSGERSLSPRRGGPRG